MKQLTQRLLVTSIGTFHDQGDGEGECFLCSTALEIFNCDCDAKEIELKVSDEPFPKGQKIKFKKDWFSGVDWIDDRGGCNRFRPLYYGFSNALKATFELPEDRSVTLYVLITEVK